MNVNRVTLAGRLTRGIELKQVPGGQQVAKLGLAINRRFKTRDGEHKIAGEVFLDGRPRIMAVDGYTMNLEPEGDMVMIFNEDQPGVIGLVGGILGDRGVNIADFMLSRREKKALMVIKLDSPMPVEVLETWRAKSPPIIKVLPVTLPAIEG